MALVDQAYHSMPAEKASKIDSTAIYHQVSSAHSSLPDPADSRPPTSWQGFFGHLYGYGATYYSYIFDRAIANKIWEDVFQGGQAAVDRAAGERYKNEVLRWGGGRNGWDCVAGVLGSKNAANANGRLAEGGDEAMREVGRWGLGRDGVSG
jgi:intermediate peptidase